MSKTVTFAKDYDHYVNPASATGAVVAYEKGWSGSVPDAHAEGAEKAGALDGATKTEKPKA